MARSRISLDGEWRFAVDPLDDGEANEWQNALPGTAEPVVVPHIWQAEARHLDYHGVAWYEKTFTPEPALLSGAAFLLFDAVDYHARVWLNGIELGEHEGGFTPFEFALGQALRAGENRLVVRVYDPLDNAEIPIGKQGSWYTRVSGIWQSVALEARPTVHIREALILPRLDDDTLLVRLRLDRAPERSVRCVVTVSPHLSEKELHRMEANVDGESAEFAVPVPGIRRWTPDDPALHDLVVRLGEDCYSTYFGMRSIECRDGMFVLNGSPLYIRGALEQAFYPGTVYRAPSDEFIKDEIAKARHMGFNLLRKHIKPELPRVLYWADRLGMLVWAEEANYVKWTPQARRRFETELRAMICRDFNRPSIIAWSLYNEEWGLEWDTAGDPAKQAYVEKLYDEIKELDPTRPVCDNSGWSHVKTDINDYHAYFALPDQAECFRVFHDDYMLGRPDDNFVAPRRAGGQPIVVSEFGVWGLPSLEKLRRNYGGGEPWWFENRSDGDHQDDYKKPLSGLKNFHRFGIDKVFADFEDLAAHSQKRMLRGVKAIIEEMRRRRGIAGYVVTEFTDIEWETNGWLDFFRDYKNGFENAAVFNGPQAILAVLPKRWYSGGERLAADVMLLNDDAAEIGDAIVWRIDALGLQGEIPVPPGRERVATFSVVLAATLPEPEAPLPIFLELSLRLSGGKEINNTYELFLYPALRAGGRLAVHELPAAFVEALAAAGWETATLADARPGDPLVTGALDSEASAAIRHGRSALFLAEAGDLAADKGEWTFRALPAGESWPYAASMQYIDASLFPGLPLAKEVGWEAEGLYPRWAVPYADYKKEGGSRVVSLFGNPGRDAQGRTVAGVFQGWLGQNGGTIVRRRVGRGFLTLCTWRIMEGFANPLAPRLFQAMLEWRNREERL